MEQCLGGLLQQRAVRRHADGQALGDTVACDVLGNSLHRLVATGDDGLVVGIDIGQVHRRMRAVDIRQQGLDAGKIRADQRRHAIALWISLLHQFAPQADQFYRISEVQGPGHHRGWVGADGQARYIIRRAL